MERVLQILGNIHRKIVNFFLQLEIFHPKNFLKLNLSSSNITFVRSLVYLIRLHSERRCLQQIVNHKLEKLVLLFEIMLSII